MAKIRQILKHVTVDIAKGTRRCRRNRQHLILAGDPCLAIRDDCGPSTRSYCLLCAEPILKLCADDLRHIGSRLFPEIFAQQRPGVAAETLDRFPPEEGNLDKHPKVPIFETPRVVVVDPQGTWLQRSPLPHRNRPRKRADGTVRINSEAAVWSVTE